MTQPEHVSLMLVYNGLDYDRDEIAQAVNDEFGTDYSSRNVGEIINGIEAEARDAANPEQVFASHYLRGVFADFGASYVSDFLP